ncbi:O-linked N-acetylglucosamine transferase, SPINDLY family protein [Roseobacteraceae bacterium S113]
MQPPSDPLAPLRHLLQAGQVADVIRALEPHVKAAPADAPALKLLAQAQWRRSPARAWPLIEHYTVLAPRDADGFDIAGQVAASLGRVGDAVARFQTALRLSPENVNFLCNLSLALTRAGSPKDAEEIARRALAQLPGHIQAQNVLGHALHANGAFDEAVGMFERTLATEARNVDALMGMARAQAGRLNLQAGLLALRRAARVAPTQAEVLSDLARAYRETCHGPLASAAYRDLLLHTPVTNPMASNAVFDMLYAPELSAQNIASQTQSFGTALLKAVPATPCPPSDWRAGARPMRVGYVSEDFRSHAASWLGGAAMAAHDPARVSISYYDTGTGRDAMTDALAHAPATGKWTSLHGQDDDNATEMIRADRLDVLVDLSGHTRGNRLGVFARRAAPVQMHWLGYPGSTGLPTMDYALFDDDHAPVGAEALFVERLIRLPRVRFAYGAPKTAPEVGGCPSAHVGHVTFGCFNNAAKLHPGLIALWAQILHQVPKSRLVLRWSSLADAGLRARIQHWFAGHDIGSERVDLAGHVPHKEMLAAYSEIDIALDTFPYCGGVTTAEALYMGVPVVSLYGEKTVSRQGLALLSAFGQPGWAQPDEDGYVACAVTLAQGAAERDALRRGQRESFLASPLADAPGLARALEDAYAACLARHAHANS